MGERPLDRKCVQIRQGNINMYNLHVRYLKKGCSVNEYAEMPAKLAGSFCIDKCEIHRHISPTRSVNKTLQLNCSSVSFSLYKNTMENQLSFFFPV